MEGSLRLLLLLAVFLIVMLAVLAVAGAVSRRSVVRSRLEAQDAPTTTLTKGTLRADALAGRWTQMLIFLESRGLSLKDSQGSALTRKLSAAGYTHPAAPRAFTLIRLLMAVGLPAAVVAVNIWFGSSTSVLRLYLVASVAGALGLYLPNVFVRAKADRRRQELINGFPDALDLLLVCVEAGLSLDAAFDRVGREMSEAHPLISELFGQLVLELRAGRSREEALGRMADRAGLEEMRSFTTLLIQSSQLGSSIAQSLRTYATEMREKRRMRAEEKAHRLPVLISLPLVGCMLPVMIGVLMLPAAIRVVRALIPAMAGQ